MLDHDKEVRRDRVIVIATQIISSRIKNKEIRPSDHEAMSRAIREAVRDAAKAYDAAVEFIGG